MTKLRKFILAGTLATVALASAGPAAADRGYRGGGDTTGAAIAGGIVGLAVGAAIASSSRDHDRYYYDGPRYPRYRTYYVYRDYPRYYPRRDWDRDRWEHERWEHRGWGDRGWHRGWDRRGW